MAARLRPWALRTAAILGASALTAALSAGPAASAAGAGVLEVGCGHGAYPTIGAAVTAASAGDTILVCRGTYHELVTVPASKPLTIQGAGHPVIDATGLGDPATGQYSAVLVLASHSVIAGLTVEGALGEDILVQGAPGSPVTGVTIRDNTVTGNDQGNRNFSLLTSSPYGQCNEVPTSPPDPGDCGEGIHLWTATDSAVVGNVVTGNDGGVLLTDEYGPTHGNLIAFNTVSDNDTDCGVTLGSHNPAAAPGGVPDPAAAGVYSNLIEHNSVTDSGRHGEGGGVLMGTALTTPVYVAP